MPPIRNLKAALSLAFDDDIAVSRVQFNLANVAAAGINLFGDQCRALRLPPGLTFRDLHFSSSLEFLENQGEHVKRCARRFLANTQFFPDFIAWVREISVILHRRR